MMVVIVVALPMFVAHYSRSVCGTNTPLHSTKNACTGDFWITCC